MPPAELAATLEHRSGLLGLAGSADMRAILAAEERGEAEPQLAVAVYLHRLRAGIAAMAAAMGGLDALVFTGGVGENAAADQAADRGGPRLPRRQVDPARNEGAGDREIGARNARVRTFVVAAREDLEIARQVRETLGRPRPAA